jgi:uncharacterized protein YecT (DUF1311 family)
MIRAVVFAFLCLTAPAAAQTFTVKTLTDCLLPAELKGSPQAGLCVGRAATQCFETEGSDTTVGMAYCLQAETREWDRLLNAAWPEALKAAQEMDADNRASDPKAPESAKTLREAQRAWITFRDASCLFEEQRYHGGSIAPLAAQSCVMHLTGAQAIRLRSQTSL